MTKAELVDSISKGAKILKKDSEKALTAAIDSITKALVKGDSVRLVGFGTFEVVLRKSRKGRNPRTGKAIQIKASKSPKFRPGKAMKDAVSGKK